MAVERAAARGAGDKLSGSPRRDRADGGARPARGRVPRVQRADVDRRLQALEDRERNIEQQSEELKRAKRVQRRELERISGLSAAQAKQILVADIEQEARHQAALRLQEIERETRHEAERRAGTSSRSRCSGWPHRMPGTTRHGWLSCPVTR